MNNIVVNLPIDPPWVDEQHFPECENRQLFQCPECKSLVPDNYLNICERNCNLRFIPRISDCVCDAISYESEEYR